MKRKAADTECDPDPLSPAQRREILRRIRDMDDPTRYLIRDRLFEGRRMQLYYNVSDDVWSSSRAGATLFKRRPSAVAIARLLGAETRILKVAGKVKPG